MSRIEDLIARHCPRGVEYKPLGDVVKNLDSQRRPVTRSDRSAGQYPYYGANGVQDFVDGYLFDGTFLLVGEDGSVVQPDGSPVVNWAEGKIWVNNHAHVLVSSGDSCDLRFLYFFLTTVEVRPYVTGGTQPKLNQGNMNKISIPVPPIEVQREIVRILDHFTKLEAELEARRHQYEHYRRDLLLTDSAVEWTTLGDIVKNFDSQRRPVTRSLRSKGVYPYYGANGVQDYVEDYIFDGTFLLVGEDGSVKQPDGTPVLNWATGKIWVNNHAHVLISADESFDLRYLFHYLTTVDISSYVTGGTQPKLNQRNMNRIPVPRVSPARQSEVVTILDSFDALVNDLSIGLPAELAARRKQYEHYRDRLLTFEELPA